MTISEAVKLALKEDKYIKLAGSIFRTKIKPTNTSECCIMISEHRSKVMPRWNPTADDLVSDDWEVVD